MEPQVPTLQEDQIQTPTPSNNGKNNSIVIVSMALFVLISFSALAFLYYQNQQLKQMLVNYQKPPPTPTATPTTNPTSNWKTYTNEKMFLSIKYPEDRNLEATTSQNNQFNFTLNTEQYAPVFFDAVFLPKTQMEKWYTQAYTSAAQTNQTRPSLKQGPIIDGKTSLYSDFVQYGSGEVRHIFVQLGDGLYQFVIPTSNNDLQYQILSTLKFLDEATPKPTINSTSVPQPSSLPIQY